MNKYNFKESAFSDNFAKAKIQALHQSLATSASVNLVSLPGVGTTNLLRFYTTHSTTSTIFLDAFALSQVTKENFYRYFLEELGGSNTSIDEQTLLNQIKEKLLQVLETSPNILIIFNRFELLKVIFDAQLFANLRWLQVNTADKITYLATSTKPLHILCPEAFSGSNAAFFSKTFYHGPYDLADLNELVNLEYKDLDLSRANRQKLLGLSGGHIQLMQLLLKQEYQKDSYLDPFVKVQVERILMVFTRQERQILQKIAQGKSTSSVPHIFYDYGLLNEKKEFFSPLVPEFILTQTKYRLPYRENTLFKTLNSKLGEVVDKETLFAAIWGKDWDDASDWALNSLIYRLRGNPWFASRYTIDSHKKFGYSLHKN